ncbi:hypothetical protein [Endozoicomonas sp. SESOKO4]|uniref:hypothetical protein n=1 Tax=Endozoicomonas sp. SESOKO4 TaxID=2828745 RepID=UPI0021476644|nr:hypothetical protein [Endozoicomonas sp. SESOKO4]
MNISQSGVICPTIGNETYSPQDSDRMSISDNVAEFFLPANGKRYHTGSEQPVLQRKVSCLAPFSGPGPVSTSCHDIFLTPLSAAEHLRETLQNLIKTLHYQKITIEKSDVKKPKNQAEETKEDDKTDEALNIFIGFILYKEGLQEDRGFFAREQNRYLPDQTIEAGRVTEICDVLNKIFQEHSEGLKSNKKYFNHYGLNYDLSEMLSDYLAETGFIPVWKNNDNVSWLLRRELFRFFDIILSHYGKFSELIALFGFIEKHKADFIEIAKNDIGSLNNNLLTCVLRTDDDLRETFNKSMMTSIFERRYTHVIDSLFAKESEFVESSVYPLISPYLKFGEEFEYYINSFSDSESEMRDKTLDPLENHLKQKGFEYLGLNKFGRRRYTLNSDFEIISFLDTTRCLEINCKPYHLDDKHAHDCFKKVINSIDFLRNNGVISYSSGHKHVDVLSATDGDPAIIMAIECELQHNPYLLRFFGNEKRIVSDREAQWHKTFGDFEKLKESAIVRMNQMIAHYNTRLMDGDYCSSNLQGMTDEEKMENLKQFTGFYSRFVHMTDFQHMTGKWKDDPYPRSYALSAPIEKYMAISLLHINGTAGIDTLPTMEFRFFRCPKTAEEVQLVNEFLQAWFQYVQQCQRDNIPLEPVPADIKASGDYSPEEVRSCSLAYLEKIGLDWRRYLVFLGEA